MERRAHEEGAGEWVAYRDEPNRRFRDLRQLGFVWSSTASTTSATDNSRYDTKREAENAARRHWPYQVRNTRRGGMRVSEAVRLAAQYSEAVRVRLASADHPTEAGRTPE
jgi:hypothetical protein